jgi:hypothetical protein
MNLDNKFTALQLATINEQAALYTCACPVHVSMQITNLRKLFDYQKMCIERDQNAPSESIVEMQVHQRIAEATKKAHQLMEQCLDEILDMEGWDKTKLEMPAGIRQRIDQK